MIQLALTVRSTSQQGRADRRGQADQDHQAAIVPFSSPEVASPSTPGAADPAARAPGSTPTPAHTSFGLARVLPDQRSVITSRDSPRWPSRAGSADMHAGLIGRQVGEGVPKDRYERELFMNATSAGCQAKAADMRLWDPDGRPPH
jgi:hypothetical protein